MLCFDAMFQYDYTCLELLLFASNNNLGTRNYPYHLLDPSKRLLPVENL